MPPVLASRARTPQDGPFPIQEFSMLRSRLPLVSLLALALAATPADGIRAQPTIGSGVAPAEAATRAEGPAGVAAAAPGGAAVVVVVQSSALPDGVPLDPAEREALERAIAAADFKGKAGDTLSLRGIGSRPRLLLAGV